MTDKLFSHGKKYQLIDNPVEGGGLSYGNFTVEDISYFDKSSNIIIKGDNLEIGNELLKEYEGKVKCIYIDPPYNRGKNHTSFVGTGTTKDFSYDNEFSHNEWLSFMEERLLICKSLLAPDGALIIAIDSYEQPRLYLLLEQLFEGFNIDCIVIVHNPRGVQGNRFSYCHEFAIFVTPKKENVISKRKLLNNEIDWRSLRKHGNISLRKEGKDCFYPILVKNDEIVGFGDVCDDNFHPKCRTELHEDIYYVYPIDDHGIERKWTHVRSSVEKVKKYLRAKKLKDGDYSIQIGKDFKSYKSVWKDPKFDANSHGTRILKKLVPENNFSYPKSLYTVMECLETVIQDDKDAIVMDLFAGSGTTGHAVMELNKRDGGNRKFLLVEKEDYVETVTIPRILRVAELLDDKSPIVYYNCQQELDTSKLKH